jgi:hypothetical protein
MTHGPATSIDRSRGSALLRQRSPRPDRKDRARTRSRSTVSAPGQDDRLVDEQGAERFSVGAATQALLDGVQPAGVVVQRFATAAEQLGSDKPAVRLAGVYAMAGLADDWEENRQTCVDVLCPYLRMPYEPDPGQDAPEPQRLAFHASREVRHTVIRVITAHLREDATVPWQGLDLDFTAPVMMRTRNDQPIGGAEWPQVPSSRLGRRLASLPREPGRLGLSSPWSSARCCCGW